MKLFSGKKILIVDDENEIRELLKEELEYNGAETVEAVNGKIAFEIFSKQGPFDIIISDVRMPGGNGTDLLKNVMSSTLAKPKFYLITGFADISSPEAIRLGAKALISKPFHIDHLIELISKN